MTRQFLGATQGSLASMRQSLVATRRSLVTPHLWHCQGCRKRPKTTPSKHNNDVDYDRNCRRCNCRRISQPPPLPRPLPRHRRPRPVPRRRAFPSPPASFYDVFCTSPQIERACPTVSRCCQTILLPDSSTPFSFSSCDAALVALSRSSQTAKDNALKTRQQR